MGTIIVIVGFLISLGCFIWLLITAFQSDLWGHGVAMILCGCYALIYSITHWNECSTPFLGMVVGSLITAGGQAMLPGIG